MSVTFKNQALTQIQGQLQGYDSTTDTDKNNRTDYVKYNSLTGGTFETTAKPGWLNRAFNKGNVVTEIDQTRKVFLRAVVDEFIASCTNRKDLLLQVPSKDASISELKNFAKNVFSPELQAALKIDDYGEWGVRVPLSKFRVNEALNQLGKEICPADNQLGGSIIGPSRKKVQREALFKERIMPAIEQIKNMTVEFNIDTNLSEDQLNLRKRLVTDIMKFEMLYMLFFGKTKTPFLQQEIESLATLLESPGCNPRDLLTYPNRTDDILKKWRETKNVFCRMLADAVEKVLASGVYNGRSNLYTALQNGHNRPLLQTSLNTRFLKVDQVTDAFDKCLHYVICDNCRINPRVHRCCGSVPGHEKVWEDGQAILQINLHSRNVECVAELYEKLNPNAQGGNS